MPTILYLHGFLSSPQSKKAQVTQSWFEQHAPQIVVECPRLSSYPAQAKKQLDDLVLSLPDIAGVIGSSLGGFWASYLVERFNTKAVLVNPAVAPHTRFQHFVGRPLKSYYSDEIYTLGDQDLAVLSQCDAPSLLRPEQYKVLLQTGDETLDYRQAAERYRDCQLVIEEGGHHSFQGYEEHLQSIHDFFFEG